MEKIKSLLKKRFDLPSSKEVRLIARTLEHKEKIAFWVFFLIFVIGFGGLLQTINERAAASVPIPGGTIYEGMAGMPRFVNPLITISDADRDLVELIYAGLMKPDGKGGLMPELAEKYEISEDGLSYTFTLKDGLTWHDGEPLTAEDVVFTIKTAQTPLVRSQKRANWEGVDVEALDARAVRFQLKKPYSPFLGNTTLEIIPKHIWSGAGPEQISLSQFNVEPIGAGPYKIKKVYRDTSGITSSYALEAFREYALGKPYIKEINLQFFNSENELMRAYSAGTIENVGAVSPDNADRLTREGSRLASIRLSRVFGVFFNQNKNKDLTDLNVRKALIAATDKQKIVDDVLKKHGIVISHPIPAGTLGAIDGETPENLSYNPENAKTLLAKSGWKFNETTGRAEKTVKKITAPLKISISTSMAPDLIDTANKLKEMWRGVGVEVEVKIFEMGDFDKNVIKGRDYDALLFGEVVGYDPDPFAFWHSSQRNDPGLNIAMYANIAVDKMLDAARKIVDPHERARKYIEMQKEIANDAPAIFIYSPNYLYIIPAKLHGVDTESITGSSERFANVHKWYIDTKKVWRFLIG